jgi:hypothetical protein
MTDVPISYRNADVRGTPSFEALDQHTDQALLAGSEPGLSATVRILLADSLTLAALTVVGLNAAGKLDKATYAAAAASLAIGTGNAALTFTAVEPGADGNDISIILAASDTTASVSVDGNEITIVPLTGAKSATAVAALVNADEAARLLVSTAAGGTGASDVGTAAETQLAGGVDIVEVCGVLVHAATSGASNTTIHGEVFPTGNFNVGDDSPLVFHASFNTLAKKQSLTRLPHLVFRSRRATGSPGI